MTDKPANFTISIGRAEQSNARIIGISVDNKAFEKQCQDLLLRLRENFQNAAVPHTALYEMTALRGNPVSPPRYVWWAQREAGREFFKSADEKVSAAAQELLDEGALVKSFPHISEGGPTVTRIQPLEDVNWGQDKDGFIHMYMLGDGVPDLIPELTEEHDKAIQIIQQRIDYGNAIIDTRPLKLSNELSLHPIRFGRDEVLTHKRQLEL